MNATSLRRLACWLTLTVMLTPSLTAAEAPYYFTTIAGNSPLGGPLQRLAWPLGLAIDSAGVIYLADGDHATVFKVSAAGEVSVLAGKSGEYASIDGPAATARFTALVAVAVDGSGNVFAADNHTIRKITPAGEVSTFAGQAGEDGTVDGPRADARFGNITCLAFDAAGNLYAGDGQHYTIRKITPAGIVSTIAGTAGERGTADGIGAAARFAAISAMAVSPAGMLYICDGANHTVRRISPTGDVTTIAGSPGQAGTADGPALTARFDGPRALALDPSGNLFIADNRSHTLRKLTPGGMVSTVAGQAGLVGSLDGTGSNARFFDLSGIVSDAGGNLFATDSVDGTIRKITPAGVVTTLVGVGRDNALESIDGPDSAALLAPLTGIAIAPNNDVYIADYLHSVIRKVPVGGKIFTFAGGMDQRGTTDGPGTDARFSAPMGLTVGPDGTVYVADTGNNVIRRITPEGVVSTLTGLTGDLPILNGPDGPLVFHGPRAVAVDAAGTVYVSDAGYYIVRKITPAGVVSTLAGKLDRFGEVDGTGQEARFHRLGSMVLDGAGNLYVLDGWDGGAVVRKITPAGVVSTFADTRGATGLTADAAGNVYIAGPTLKKINALGVVSTLVSKDAAKTGAGDAGPDIEFAMTGGIAVDAKGALYVASGRAVHKGQLAAAPVITTQPSGLSVAAGASVQFSVAATAIPAATYQWYFNGSPFQGATASELSFTNARASDAGDYTVVVSNAAGSSTSNAAKLIVSAAVAPPPAAGSSGGGSGGGGGAPSAWFLLGLAMLAWVRHRLAAAAGRAA
jgi:sugar lactone lactonase YvrE